VKGIEVFVTGVCKVSSKYKSEHMETECFSSFIMFHVISGMTFQPFWWDRRDTLSHLWNMIVKIISVFRSEIVSIGMWVPWLKLLSLSSSSTTKYIGLNMKAYRSRLLQHLFQFRMFVSVLMKKGLAPQFRQLLWLNIPGTLKWVLTFSF